MPIYGSPLGYTGQPPGVTGTPTTQTANVRAATVAEVNAGTLDNVYISPMTLSSAGGAINTIGATLGAATKVGNSTGTLGFFGSNGATRVTQGAITNSVTVGGTTGTIADFTDLTTYATDAPTIRNDIYQLSLALANVVGALRSYGMLA